MKCTICEFENSDNANFCSSCGASLQDDARNKPVACSICGNENEPNAAFCTNCGHPLHEKPPEHDHQKQKKGKTKHRKERNAPSVNSRFYVRSAIAVIAVIALVVLIETKESRMPVSTQQATTFQILSDSTLHVAATTNMVPAIYSQFICPCGKCRDDLNVCTCSHPHGATEVKLFIDQQVAQEAYTVQEVINMVDQKYGGRKI